MRIPHVTSLSAVNGPELCCVVFFAYCNFKCRYCYNKDLVFPKEEEKSLSIEEVYNKLEGCKKLVDYVTLTGGEPLLNDEKELSSFLRKLKELKFKVKLDTNGSSPDKLQILFDKKLIDFVSLDIKTDPTRYFLLTQKEGVVDLILSTLTLLKKSDVEFEVRIPLIPGFVDKKMLNFWIPHLKNVDRVSFNKFIAGRCLDSKFNAVTPLVESEVHTLKTYFEEKTR